MRRQPIPNGPSQNSNGSDLPLGEWLDPLPSEILMLKVTTRDLGDEIEMRVRDHGAGIPPEIKDKLFQLFFTNKPIGEGTGLGLSISRMRQVLDGTKKNASS